MDWLLRSASVPVQSAIRAPHFLWDGSYLQEGDRLVETVNDNQSPVWQANGSGAVVDTSAAENFSLFRREGSFRPRSVKRKGL